MSTHINSQGISILKTDSLKRTGEMYILATLSSANIDQILNLQNTILNALSNDQKNFIVKRTREFLENHFSKGNTVIGAIHKERLIAQSLITNETKNEHSISDFTDLLGFKQKKQTLIQGLLVDPNYWGNNLMTTILKAWIAHSQELGCTDAVARVSANNSPSLSGFLKEGFKITNTCQRSKEDPTTVLDLHTKITKPRLIQKPSFTTIRRTGQLAPSFG